LIFETLELILVSLNSHVTEKEIVAELQSALLIHHWCHPCSWTTQTSKAREELWKSLKSNQHQK